MEIIATAPSLTAARRLMDEIAVSGGWRASARGEHSVVYQKRKEEMLIVREGDRVWRVVRKQQGGEE